MMTFALDNICMTEGRGRYTQDMRCSMMMSMLQMSRWIIAVDTAEKGSGNRSLYKHYKGKADIFNALIDSAETRYEEMFGPERNIGVSCPGTGQEQQAEEKKQINLRAAKGCAWKIYDDIHTLQRGV